LAIFGHPFLELIATLASLRRIGIASALLSDIENSLEDDRFFVSADELNTIMRDLWRNAVIGSPAWSKT